MYSVSEAYSEAITKPSRRFRLSGRILLQDGTPIEITDSIVIGHPEISTQIMSGGSSEDVIDIGAVCAATLRMKIRDNSGANSFADARIRLLAGLQLADGSYEDIPMGTFYIHSPSIKRVRDVISFEAYDKMIFLPFVLTDDMRTNISGMTTYGATGYVCSLVGIQLAQDKATVEAFPNGDITLDASDTRIETARDLIMWCAQMMGCFARFDRYGRLEYVQIKAEKSENTGMIIPVREIAASQRFDTVFADGVLMITSLAMKKENGKLTRAYLNSTSSTKRSVELEIEQNPLLINQTTRSVAQALAEILSVLRTAYFRPFSATITNDPALDAGDYVRLRGGAIDTSRGYATGIITHSTWRYSGRQDIINVGAVPVVSQLEDDTAAVAETAETELTVTSAESESGDIEGNSIVYVQPKPQSEKVAMANKGSGGSTSLGSLTTYTYLTDSSIEYNGMAYTVEHNDAGLITRITDDKGGDFAPEVGGDITNAAYHNAVLTAVAMLCGLPKPITDTLTPMVQYRYNLEKYTQDETTVNLLNQASGGDVPIIFLDATKSGNSVYVVGTEGSHGEMAWSTENSEYTIYLVARCESVHALRIVDTQGNAGVSPTGAVIYGQGGGIWRAAAYNGGTAVNSAVPQTQLAVLAVRMTAAQFDFYANGVHIGTTAQISSLLPGVHYFDYGHRWGADNPGGCYYYDIAFAVAAHSDADVIKNSKYLMAKYGIT